MSESIFDSVSNFEGEEEFLYRNNGDVMLNNNIFYYLLFGEMVL